MRARYVMAIVAENVDAPTPVDVVDFQDFETQTPDGRPILRIKYCPFCGKTPTGPERVV